MKSKESGSFSLVGTLVAVALVLVLVLVFAFGGFGSKADNQRKDQVGETVIGQSVARAKDAKCMENLRNIRGMIDVERTNADQPPASLSELRGLPADMLVDPIGKEPYAYNPEDGTVHCIHPGHEKY